MRKIFLFLTLLFLIVGCTKQPETPQEQTIKEEQISDNSKLIIKEGTYKGKGFQRTDIKYEKDNKEFQNYFDPALKDSLDWIKENTDDNVIFLSWWDYGHMIRGYTERDVIIYSPSKDILWSLASGKWNEEESGEFSSKERLMMLSCLTEVSMGLKLNHCMLLIYLSTAIHLIMSVRGMIMSFMAVQPMVLEIVLAQIHSM